MNWRLLIAVIRLNGIFFIDRAFVIVIRFSLFDLFNLMRSWILMNLKLFIFRAFDSFTLLADFLVFYSIHSLLEVIPTID